MEIKKANPKQNVEYKEYSANQSINVRNNESTRTVEELGYNASKSADVRKGYNAEMTTQTRNDIPLKEGYNAQQMVQTANNPPAPQQQTQQSKSTKNSDAQK